MVNCMSTRVDGHRFPWWGRYRVRKNPGIDKDVGERQELRPAAQVHKPEAGILAGG